jgi:general secretion pathway protein K
MRRPCTPPRRGAALLLAMLILVLVATFTGAMVWQQNRSLQVEAAERSRAQSAWILSGALDWARLILREDARSTSGGGARSVDSLDEPWNTPLAESRLSTFLAVDKDNNAEDQGPEAFLSGAIVDAQSRWNLRNLFDAAGKEAPAERATLARLCAQANVSADVAQRIVDLLRGAWGPVAAAPGTAAVANPVLPPSRLADLVWLGIDKALLERLEPWVDVLPVATPVNVNTAPREVLVGVIEGLDLGTAERLVRVRQSKPFTSIDQFKAQLPEGLLKDANRISVGSGWFHVMGRLRLEERVLEEHSLLERRGTEVTVARRERVSLDASQAGPLGAGGPRRP